ncbi:hypothetical protein VIN30_01600 [Adlercreutzia sp. R7]|uniref:Translation repressor RelB n=1 Tax=Adlercreutzia wanghongyangiae TaxID=3111451 RepID=A0ABU6IFD2_9ACTN|nr:hypothetical protein [Adlercreutzia sp. R7]
MPNAQMNFRIDAELKRRGDERFARFGCTPSEAMRRLYECAARYDDESEGLLRSLIGTEPSASMSEGEKRAQAITDFLASLQAQREALGIPPSASPQEFSDEYWDNLFYEAKSERLAERGLW